MKYSLESILGFKHREIADVLDGDYCNLESSIIYNGEHVTLAWIADLIFDVFDLVKVGKKIGIEEVKTLSEFIVDEFRWLTIADLKLALKRGCAGRYGEIYDRLDVPVIMGWIRCYAAERVQVSENRRRSEEDLRMKEDKSVPMPEEIKVKLIDLEARMNTAKVQKSLRSAHFKSVEQYCEEMCANFSETIKSIQAECDLLWGHVGDDLEQYGMTKDNLLAIETNKFLKQKSIENGKKKEDKI